MANDPNAFLINTDYRALSFVQKWEFMVGNNTGTPDGYGQYNTYITHTLNVIPLVFGVVSTNPDMSNAVDISSGWTYQDNNGTVTTYVCRVSATKKWLHIECEYPSGKNYYFKLFAVMPKNEYGENNSILDSSSLFNLNSDESTLKILWEGTGKELTGESQSVVPFDIKGKFNYYPVLSCWEEVTETHGETLKGYRPTYTNMYVVDNPPSYNKGDIIIYPDDYYQFYTEKLFDGLD